MGNESWLTSADFIYVARDGTRYSVRGWQETNPSRYCRKVPWRAFRVDVRVYGDHCDRAASPCYCISKRIHDFRAQSATWDDGAWLRALRRYAIEDALAALVCGTLDAERCRMVTSDATGPLDARMDRLCRHQVAGDGKVYYCAADPQDPQPTTVALCNACGMPDPWEGCAHIRHPKVHPSSPETLQALCNRGNDPGGAIPYLCRAGQSQPSCFEPPVIQSNDPLLVAIGIVAPPRKAGLSLRQEDSEPA